MFQQHSQADVTWHRVVLHMSTKALTRRVLFPANMTEVFGTVDEAGSVTLQNVNSQLFGGEKLFRADSACVVPFVLMSSLNVCG